MADRLEVPVGPEGLPGDSLERLLHEGAEVGSQGIPQHAQAGLSGAETAVFYEQSMNTGFGQSCRGYVLLRYLGYPKIRILHGGYSAWVAAGFPSTTTVPVPAAASFPVRIYLGSWNEWSRDLSLPIEKGLPYAVGREA